MSFSFWLFYLLIFLFEYLFIYLLFIINAISNLVDYAIITFRIVIIYNRINLVVIYIWIS